jgi:hypothetical protein
MYPLLVLQLLSVRDKDRCVQAGATLGAAETRGLDKSLAANRLTAARDRGQHDDR